MCGWVCQVYYALYVGGGCVMFVYVCGGALARRDLGYATLLEDVWYYLFEGISELLDSDHICCLGKHLRAHQLNKVIKVNLASSWKYQHEAKLCHQVHSRTLQLCLKCTLS